MQINKYICKSTNQPPAPPVQVSSPNPGRPQQEQTPHPGSHSLPRCSLFWSDQSGFLP